MEVKECWACRECSKESKYKINPPIPKDWVDSKELGLLCLDCYNKKIIKVNNK